VLRFLPAILAALALCVFFSPNASAQGQLSINSVRIGTHPDKVRMVMELSHVSDYRAFVLQGPPRLVVDLPNFSWKAGNPSAPPGSGVRAIRNGPLQPGIQRIVVDLDKQASLKAAFILPAGSGQNDRLVVDYKIVGNEFNPALEKTYGNLNTSLPTTGAIAPAPQTVEVTKVVSTTNIQTVPQPKPDAPSSAPALQLRNGKKFLIVIDPGHGGQDPGAIGANGTKEKTITLAAAQELRKQLEATGRYRVVLTRDNDKFIKLQDRVGVARRSEADLFISLHADSIDKPGVNGASIYTLSNTASDAQTAKLAARENRADLIAGVDLSHEDKEVANILIDLAMRDTMNQSKFFANGVVTHADKHGINLLERPHRYAGFAVLKAPDIPSVLFEMGFMSNKAEANRLSSPEYRQKLVRAMVAGIDGYFAKVAKNGQN
jgi:N-acetylmuramoyl-L-alanine amidase